MYLSKVTANSARARFSKWPPLPFWKNMKFHISGPIWARRTIKVSISTNIGMLNTLKWLFLSFGTFLVAKSKMAAILKIRSFISLAPDELERQTMYRFPLPLVLSK